MDKVEILLDALAVRLGEAVGDDTEREAVLAALAPLSASLRDAMSDQIGQLTQMDPATTVNNQRALEDAAETEFSRARRYRRELSAVAIEVDGFNEVGGAHGDDGGDAFLRTMILDCCRGIRVCDIVGRTDTAAFTILLPETPLAGAVQVAQRLSQIMRETPIPVGEEVVSYTVSAGVADAEFGDGAGRPLLERATEALRRARALGPDGIIVARLPYLDDDMPTIQDAEVDFNKALGGASVEYLAPEDL